VFATCLVECPNVLPFPTPLVSVQATAPMTKRRNRRKQAGRVEADVTLFIRQYGRKANKRIDPNDRHYDRQIEKLAKKMPPEELNRLLSGGGD